MTDPTEDIPEVDYVEGTGVPIRGNDIDTDQIIPARFMKVVTFDGLGEFAFFDLRFDDEDDPKDHPFNEERFADANVMVVNANFGCGSSREHAPWAIKDFGIKTLISPSFADIFYNNCFKNGMLPIELDAEIVDDLFDRVENAERYEMEVDLENQILTGSDGWEQSFEVDSFRKKCLLEGLDDIALTLQNEEDIEAYENSEQAPRSLEVNA